MQEQGRLCVHCAGGISGLSRQPCLGLELCRDHVLERVLFDLSKGLVMFVGLALFWAKLQLVARARQGGWFSVSEWCWWFWWDQSAQICLVAFVGQVQTWVVGWSYLWD